jgi:hypothetical protein
MQNELNGAHSATRWSNAQSLKGFFWLGENALQDSPDIRPEGCTNRMSRPINEPPFDAGNALSTVLETLQSHQPLFKDHERDKHIRSPCNMNSFVSLHHPSTRSFSSCILETDCIGVWETRQRRLLHQAQLLVAAWEGRDLVLSPPGCPISK